MTAIHYDGTQEAWHKLRSAFIGGSDVASLFHVWMLPGGTEAVLHIGEQPDDGLPVKSLSPYKNGYRLWLEKRGGMAAEDLDEVERIRAGTFLEPAIAAWAKDKWNWPIRKVRRYHAHDEVKGWGASLDYEVHGGGVSGIPVEIKNVDYLVFKDGWTVDVDTGEIIGVPMHINLQIQAQIGAAGVDHAWVVACVGGNTLYRGRIDRHEPVQLLLSEAIFAFWNIPEAPEWLASAETCKELYRKGFKDTLADLTGDNEAQIIARRFLRWKRHGAKVEAIIDGLKGRLQAKMGEKTKAKGDGFSITWPAIHRDAKVIPAREQAELDYRGGFTLKEITK